jgi:hypothetical protein
MEHTLQGRIMRRAVLMTLLLSGIATNMTRAQDPPKHPGVVELFEDDAEGLLKLLMNTGDGPGKGDPEATVVFSGTKSLKVSEYQRFQRKLPGWDYAIREKPNAGEYRYLRLAWKADGANCMMLQLHDATDWHIRYTAGANPYGWMTRFVADKAPGVWTLVTIDLFKDFGERTLTGIAFTISGGPGYFDHVYLGHTIADLDRIDAGGLADKKLVLEKQDLERLWRDLAAEDAAVKYRAFWTLVGGGAGSAAILKGKTSPVAITDAETKQLREWIRNLDSEAFAVREKATAELRKRAEAAAFLLEAELERTPSPEVRRRIETLIASVPGRDGDRSRREQAQRVLEFIGARKK